ncbi:hypothetical protein HanHA300_Chr05g0182671 [Helianthus annuus]|nr:hypothetical protein HanHA300_Chr05g0182671 [Helianthus annuus]KAJ0577796.1 hypothetical protein HanIR_Chr05g0240071 [Helianthus annuus]KAJ0747725.1 hypothetical protein HanOQP8_Chr05g0192861 [Helianthus annuus]KAJ0923400.1 hypothetical protein HanPSC8_Chr05g0215451 [Helianthus annuus]
MTLWGLLQGDCMDIKFMVGDMVNPDMSCGLEKKASGTGSSVRAGDYVVEEKDEKDSSDEAGDSRGSLRVQDSSDDEDDEDLESRLLRKRKAAQASSPKAASKLPPARTKGSLSKHLRSSSRVSEPLLVSSKAPIVIPPVPASSRVRDKTPEISAARVNPTFDIFPLQATGTSKPSHPEVLPSRSPLAPLFAEGLPVPYVPKWKVTASTVVGTPETARDYLDYAVPPPHKFMNFVLNPDLFDDQYSMSLCEGLFKGASML